MLLVDKYNETAVHKIGHISAHVLRHTGCTRYVEKGIDLKVLQYLMGHSTTQITNDVYNHVRPWRYKELYITLQPYRNVSYRIENVS